MSKRKNKGFLNSIEREILVMLVFDWGYSVICVLNDISVINGVCVINVINVIYVIYVPNVICVIIVPNVINVLLVLNVPKWL